MPHCLPPIEHRFKKGNPSGNHTQKHPNGYLTPLLKKFLNKKINFEDPETKKIINGKVKDAVIWRLLLNACQGENEAIKEILNRIDGKLIETQIDQSQHSHFTYMWSDENGNNNENNSSKQEEEISRV